VIVLNRAKAEHVVGSKIKLTWACGKYRTKDYSKRPVARRLSEEGCLLMVRMWRSTGTTAPCPAHGKFADDCGYWVLDENGTGLIAKLP
jgi:hypothetical protein